MDFVFDLLNDRSPHEGSKSLFSYGNAQIDEMSPIIIDMNLEDLRYVTKSSHIAIPSIKLTFIQICRTSRRAEKKIYGS